MSQQVIQDKSQEERQAKIASLRERFKNVPVVTNSGRTTMPMATADAIKIVGTIADVVGLEHAFHLRDLHETAKNQMCAGFGINADDSLTSHQISQALASAMRRAKETEVDYNKTKVVLMNQPGEGTRPSQWCVFKV